MYYFKSIYDPLIETNYYQNWYGNMEFAPDANVLLYNDEEGFCIGILEESIKDFRRRMILNYWDAHNKTGTSPIVEYDINNYTLPYFFSYISEEEALTIIELADNNNPKIYKDDKLNTRWN